MEIKDRIRIKRHEKGLTQKQLGELSGIHEVQIRKDDKLFQFYAGTGKIQGFTQVRGIHSLIQMLEG